MKNKTLALLAGVGVLGYFAMKSQANATTGSGAGSNAGNYMKNGQLYNQWGNPITGGGGAPNYLTGTRGGGSQGVYGGNSYAPPGSYTQGGTIYNAYGNPVGALPGGSYNQNMYA